jgi:hypothetical protein
MYRIEQDEPSINFKQAWSAAGRHIQSQADTGFNWLRAELNPPMAEHLSFRIGNQIFFIFIEAAEFNFTSGRNLFSTVCKTANAIPCLMPMEKHLDSWRPVYGGWGLINADSGNPLNPLDYVSDELIEMSDWELHDFAIQVVCSTLESDGKSVFSKQSSMSIDPSIWFRDNEGSHYVVVRAGRYPNTEILPPENMPDIVQGLLAISKSGYFAPVIFANAQDPFDPHAKNNGNFLPLYRGHAMYPKFTGLMDI